MNAAKALYDKRNLTWTDIETNSENQPIKFHFPKTDKANELTVYIAVIKHETIERS